MRTKTIVRKSEWVGNKALDELRVVDKLKPQKHPKRITLDLSLEQHFKLRFVAAKHGLQMAQFLRDYIDSIPDEPVPAKTEE